MSKLMDFQYSDEKGGINIRFNLDFDGETPLISNIAIHSSFDSGLPRHPSIKEYNEKKAFYVEYNGSKGRMYQYFNDALSKKLIAFIYEKAYKELENRK